MLTGPLLLMKAVGWSEALCVVMESNGFSGDAVRTEYNDMRLRSGDWRCPGDILLTSAAVAPHVP